MRGQDVEAEISPDGDRFFMLIWWSDGAFNV